MSFGGRAAALLVSCLMISVIFASLTLVSVKAADTAPELENPLAVIKYPGSPRDSAVTRSFTSDDYGMWVHWVENSGLRSLTIDIFDTSSGVAVEVSHIRIRFAAYDAFPVGYVQLPGVVVAAGRTYEITLTPNGPPGAYAQYFHPGPCCPPVANFAISVDYLTVWVDASTSYDVDGSIVDYQWDWGDGSPAGSGAMTSHDYPMEGIFVLSLTVTDNDGLMGVMSQMLDLRNPVPNSPPVARFFISSDHVTHMAKVDASSSADYDGEITEYLWDWGDGTPYGTGVTASHQYGSGASWWITLFVTDNEGLADSEDEVVWFGPPTEPMIILYGYLYADDGSLVVGGEVIIKNLMSGEVLTTSSDDYGGYVEEFIFGPPVQIGDVIEVTAVKGDLSGTNSAVVEMVGFIPMQIDVYLSEAV